MKTEEEEGKGGGRRENGKEKQEEEKEVQVKAWLRGSCDVRRESFKKLSLKKNIPKTG